MAANSRGFLFRKRNVLGAALLAGIGLGVYFGKFDGFGLGGGKGTGPANSSSTTQVSTDSGGQIKELAENKPSEDEIPVEVPKVVRVLIDDHQFLLRGASGAADVPIELPKLVSLVRKAPGDADGFRVRIYRKTTARASAEERLKGALAAAGITDTAILWVPLEVR
jgi:hypothetical protein